MAGVFAGAASFAGAAFFAATFFVATFLVAAFFSTVFVAAGALSATFSGFAVALAFLVAALRFAGGASVMVTPSGSKPGSAKSTPRRPAAIDTTVNDRFSPSASTSRALARRRLPEKAQRHVAPHSVGDHVRAVGREGLHGRVNR